MRKSESATECSPGKHEERVPLKNLRTGEIGYSLGFESGGRGIMVDLGNGEVETWGREECAEESIH